MGTEDDKVPLVANEETEIAQEELEHPEKDAAETDPLLEGDASKKGAATANVEGGELEGDVVSNYEAVGPEDLTTTCETFWNICNTIQGLPILAIPYTFKSGGWWSLLALVVIAITSNFTSRILVKSLYEVHDGVVVRVRSSYMDIGEAFWKSGGRSLVIITMVIELLFVSTMYPILVGAMFNKSFPNVAIPIWGWTMIGGLALLPNSLLRNLSQVAWTSIITVASALIIFISICAFALTKVGSWKVSNMNTFNASEYPAAIGILVSCYLAQPFVPYLESTMKEPKKFNSTLNGAFVSMTAVSVIVGVLASLAFYPNIDEVITNNLPEGVIRAIVNGMAAILAFTSYTLPMFTSFDVIEKSGMFGLPKDFGTNLYSCPVQSLRLGLVVATILMALIPKYTYLLAFVGSLTGITLEFIYPVLFHMKIYCSTLSYVEFGMDITVVFIGTVSMVISLGVSWVAMYDCFGKGVC